MIAKTRSQTWKEIIEIASQQGDKEAEYLNEKVVVLTKKEMLKLFADCPTGAIQRMELRDKIIKIFEEE